MVIQMQALRSNRTDQAVSLPNMQTADYSRIVGGDENLHAVMLEAIDHQCFVFSDGKSRTVISKSRPRGFYKVHATYRMPDFPPEAA